MSLIDRARGAFSPTPPRVEALRMEHALALAGLHAANFARGWDVMEFQALLADRHVVADGLFRGRGAAPLGFALSRAVLDEAEVLTIAVARPQRGRGLGRHLLDAHLAELERRGVKAVFLEVEEDNVAALRLYRAAGFREAGRREAYYRKADGTARAALLMRRDGA